MLPKIAVGEFADKSECFENLALQENLVMFYDGENSKIDELRNWLYQGINILKTRPEYSMMVWNADLLSRESQAVLLKPMEELENNMDLILVVRNENELLSTILSRAVVYDFKKPIRQNDEYWNEVRKCWASGPAAGIALSDSLNKDQAVEMMEEVIRKLHEGLNLEINIKRLKILDLAITSLSELKQTNINQKLCVDSFLISSWRIIKA